MPMMGHLSDQDNSAVTVLHYKAVTHFASRDLDIAPGHNVILIIFLINWAAQLEKLTIPSKSSTFFTSHICIIPTTIRRITWHFVQTFMVPRGWNPMTLEPLWLLVPPQLANFPWLLLRHHHEVKILILSCSALNTFKMNYFYFGLNCALYLQLI